jgi:DNA gyrase subunit B
LNAYLLSLAVDKAELHVNADAPAVQGPALEALARKHMEVTAIIDRWSRRYDGNVLREMMTLPQVGTEQLSEEKFWTDWAARLEDALKTKHESLQYEVVLNTDEESAAPLFMIRTTRHGLTSEKHIQIEFFESAEYQRIAAIGSELFELIGEGAYVVRGEQSTTIDSFGEAMEWLMKQARKGLNFQRYKGLGEMNPDQLWDTTINPETRLLMQVRIEDAVASDELFTTLMGDQVEPRREFIEKNALAVSNLDV